MELNQFRDVDVVLDKANDNIIQKQFVSAGDKDGRSLTAQLTDNGVIGEIIGATLNLYWHNQASGVTDLSAFYVVDRATSVFKIDYPQNMLTPGKVIAYIQILHSGKVTHTKPFEITVQKLAGTTRGVLATAEYGALVTTLAKANEFETEIAVLDNGKMDKNTNNISVAQINKNLGKLDQTYMTEDFLQQMVGNTPINAVPADKSITQIKLSDRSVTTDKTDFFTEGKNHFNKYSVSQDKRVDGNTGDVFTMVGVSTSDFIAVLPSTSYHRNFTDAYAIYTSAGAFISGGDSASANKVISIPSNGAKIRLSVKDANLNSFQFEKGTTGTEYEMYKGVLSEIVRIKEKSLPEIGLTMTNFGHITSGTANIVNPQEVQEGLINSDGSITYPQPYYKHTGFIYVKDTMAVTVTGTQTGVGPVRRSYAFYDANKTFIGGFTGASSGFTNPVNIPADAYFARFSFDSSCTDYQIEYGSLATTYTAFNPKYEVLSHVLPDSQAESISPFSGNVLVTNGDSITYGTTGTLPFVGGNYDNQVPWPQFVAEALKMGLSNHAIGGSTIAVKETSPNERDPIVTRYASMADGDVIIIAGGSNDWQYSWTPLGDMTSRSNFTFYGALHNLCLGLLEKYKGKQIVFTTPIKRGQLSQESVNANGKTLNEYGDIIKEVCGYYGIPVIDMYTECTINPHIDTQRSEFIPDTVHPNRTGHELMAKRIGGYLRQLA